MKLGSSPAVVTSRRRIVYRESAWRVHEFEVFGVSGTPVCRAAALRMAGSALVWAGIPGVARLDAVAAGVPGASTVLVGEEGTGLWAVGVARRLAAALSRPVFVCCGEEFDRFTAPLVERAIVAQLKAQPDCLPH